MKAKDQKLSYTENEHEQALSIAEKLSPSKSLSKIGRYK